jgi:hypothetical protein
MKYSLGQIGVTPSRTERNGPETALLGDGLEYE